MESNLQCPYKFTANPQTQAYNFTTNNNIIYNVAFIVDEGLLDSVKAYHISIKPENEKQPPKDYRVQATIESIINRFFQNKNNVLIYICDAADSRQYQRHLLFGRWYNSSEIKDFVIKLDAEIKNTDHFQYASVLYHKENTDKEILINEFKEIVNALGK